MITAPEVRVTYDSGESVGIVSLAEALRLAGEAQLDLVEVAAAAKPPVCKIMDYGKFKYELAKKKKIANKKQAKVQNKEIKFHLKTDTHDYDFKVAHAKKFLLKGNRVKITMVFRGREIVYKDLGLKTMEKIDTTLSEIATAERKFVLEGRNMISNYVPDKKKIKDYLKEHADELNNDEDDDDDDLDFDVETDDIDDTKE